jgi:MFS transporter, SP family, major inositol transporter
MENIRPDNQTVGTNGGGSTSGSAVAGDSPPAVQEPGRLAQPERPSGATLYVTLIAAVAALGGLLFGFDTGVIAGAILFIVPEFHLVPAQQGLVVSAVTFGALFGALAGGNLSDAIGQRRTNIFAGVSFVAGAILSAISPNVDILIASRVLIGLAIGLTSVAAPMYIAELSPARSRGKLVSLFQLAITIGIVASYVVDRALAPDHAWRWMSGSRSSPGRCWCWV